VELTPGVWVGGPPASPEESPLPVIAGPCALESEEVALAVAEWLADLARRLPVAAVFKSSFDKANRSSLESYRGPGLERGLELLARVKEATGLPLLTDVHEPDQCAPVAEVVDVLQIPAFLCRQTDLVLAAAGTGRALNVKKGQFMAPEDMVRVVEKAASVGNDRVTVTERGYSLGYHDLVVDMRSFPLLHRRGIPVIYDVTHSLQLPGSGAETGGLRELAEPLARAAVAAGADGVFVEVHPDPESARSDRATQLPPGRAARLLESLVAVRRAIARL
jgi:2-dehydro-3-deoxyphosphooctonate aldolase (KDO 8-P synthase)